MTDTVKGTFIDGISYKEKKLKNFELRQVETVGDMFDAEQESGGAHFQMNFAGALGARQLVRVDDFDGPFSFQQIRGLSPRDFMILREAQGKLGGEQQNNEKEG